MKEVAGKDEGQSELWSGAMQPDLQTQQLGSILEKMLQKGSTQNLWFLKGPIVEDRRDAKVLASKWIKKRVLAS